MSAVYVKFAYPVTALLRINLISIYSMRVGSAELDVDEEVMVVRFRRKLINSYCRHILHIRKTCVALICT